MKRQLAKVTQIKAKIQTAFKLVSLGIKKYIVALIDLENQLEVAQKKQMISFVKTNELTITVFYDNTKVGSIENCGFDYKVYYPGAGMSGWKRGFTLEEAIALFQDKAEELYLEINKCNEFWGTKNIKMENKKSRIVNASERWN